MWPLVLPDPIILPFSKNVLYDGSGKLSRCARSAGVPNCGKSSLINALKAAAKGAGLLSGEQAYGKTAVTGPLPGVTRHLQGFQVSRDPQARCGNRCVGKLPPLHSLDADGKSEDCCHVANTAPSFRGLVLIAQRVALPCCLIQCDFDLI